MALAGAAPGLAALVADDCAGVGDGALLELAAGCPCLEVRWRGVLAGGWAAGCHAWAATPAVAVGGCPRLKGTALDGWQVGRAGLAAGCRVAVSLCRRLGMAPELPAPAAEKCGSVYAAACARWELRMSSDASPDVSGRGAAVCRLCKATARMGVTYSSCAAGSSHSARRQAAIMLGASARAHGPGRRGAGASAPVNPRHAAQEISLRRCARVTDAGVAALAAGCLLRRLGLPGCHALGAPAMIALAGPRGCASRRCSREPGAVTPCAGECRCGCCPCCPHPAWQKARAAIGRAQQRCGTHAALERF